MSHFLNLAVMVARAEAAARRPPPSRRCWGDTARLAVIRAPSPRELAGLVLLGRDLQLAAAGADLLGVHAEHDYRRRLGAAVAGRSARRVLTVEIYDPGPRRYFGHMEQRLSSPRRWVFGDWEYGLG